MLNFCCRMLSRNLFVLRIFGMNRKISFRVLSHISYLKIEHVHVDARTNGESIFYRFVLFLEHARYITKIILDFLRAFDIFFNFCRRQPNLNFSDGCVHYHVM